MVKVPDISFGRRAFVELLIGGGILEALTALPLAALAQAIGTAQIKIAAVGAAAKAAPSAPCSPSWATR